MNWEALLAFRPPDELFFVTDDVDFYSPLDAAKPLEYLATEWETNVGTPLTLVRRLSELPVPDEVRPRDDAPDERDDLVFELQSSVNFARTHMLIAELARIPRFTPRQVRELVNALDNTQVGWILHDDDVRSFYEWLAETHGSDLTDEELARLRALLSPPTVEATEGTIEL